MFSAERVNKGARRPQVGVNGLSQRIRRGYLKGGLVPGREDSSKSASKYRRTRSSYAGNIDSLKSAETRSRRAGGRCPQTSCSKGRCEAGKDPILAAGGVPGRGRFRGSGPPVGRDAESEFSCCCGCDGFSSDARSDEFEGVCAISDFELCFAELIKACRSPTTRSWSARVSAPASPRFNRDCAECIRSTIRLIGFVLASFSAASVFVFDS